MSGDIKMTKAKKQPLEHFDTISCPVKAGGMQDD